jgi:hypothetical protein
MKRSNAEVLARSILSKIAPEEEAQLDDSDNVFYVTAEAVKAKLGITSHGEFALDDLCGSIAFRLGAEVMVKLATTASPRAMRNAILEGRTQLVRYCLEPMLTVPNGAGRPPRDPMDYPP